MTVLRLLLAVLFSAVALSAAEPVLTRVDPVGAQRGTAFRLDLYGNNISDAAVLRTTLPGSVTPLIAARAMKGPALSFLVELPADAAIGLYPLRLEAPGGLSNLILFSVGEFPDVSETDEPNDTPETAQSLDLPTTVNGRLKGSDRDVYRFNASAGEQLVLEVEARRAGSAVDPVLRILDAQGDQLAVNNDAPTLGLDARIAFRAPSAGVYYAVVHDARFSKQDADSYRLKIGDFDFAEGFFPLGGPRGKTVSVDWFGGSLKRPTSSPVDLSQVEEGLAWTTIHTPGRPGALPSTFVVSDHEEELENGRRRLTPGRVLNGRIGDSGEVDRYQLAVEPGQSWRLSLDAATLGSSQLYPLLSVFHKDELLARSGDEIPEKRTTSLEENTLVSRDPFILLDVPDGVNELTLVVEDLVDRGGPNFGYRLLADQGRPDFTLSLSTPEVSIPVGGVAHLNVSAVRRGFSGPIKLFAEGLPDGVTTEGGHLSALFNTKDSVGVAGAATLALRAAKNADLRAFPLTVWGEAVLPDGGKIRRRASAPGLVTPVRSRPGIRGRELPARADWLSAELPARVAAAHPARIVLDGPAQVRIVKGTEYPLRWKLESSDPSIKALTKFRLVTPGARETTFSPRDPEAEWDGAAYVKYLRTTMGGPAQTFDAVLTAQARIAGVNETLASPMITIQVVDGFSLAPAHESVTVSQGAEFDLIGKIDRDSAFPNPIGVSVGDLPKGVSCNAPSPTMSSTFRLDCQTEPDAEIGIHEILLTAASTMAGRGEGKNVPYQVDPVAVALALVEADQP